MDAAIAGSELKPLVIRLTAGNRPAITHRLEQLEQVRSLVAHKLTTAEMTDLDFDWNQQASR